ncbi:M13 family metallopeptidase [Corynebacterium pilosum]|uniref:Predicted metalloendopeptidase n=1 Tax=Corynebacterium pilosum TaxID=35756 RepID=A0A376CNY0_9CORY|nr:M13-type metalloendopeptidase [Corynebacterium pilosum]STC69358.1 predicted metalloendopeptidase [Corynebacterium pilosum]
MNDLYQFVNGPWLKSHVIPDDRGVDGTFHKLRDDAETNVHDIVAEGNGLASTLFASFMDTDAINNAGVAPLDDDFALLSVADIDEFAAALGKLERVGVGAPLTYFIEKDSQGENSVAYLVQSGLGLPDEAYYRSESHADTLAEYEKHVAEMLGFLDPEVLFGLPVEAAATRIVAMEKELAAGHWDVVKTRDAMATYNPTDISELPEIIQTMLAGSGLTEGRVINMMPSFTDHLARLLRPDNLADWQLWATWAILRSRAGVLAEEIGAKNFEFYGTTLSGATQQRDRWKRGVGLAESLVGEDIGKEYVARFFPRESKESMLELVTYLIRAYRERISQLEWMTETTRVRATEKLAQFNAKIGYPDIWRSFDTLEFSPAGTHVVDNVRRGAEFEHDYQLNKLGRPADRDEWVTTPQTVNAFYNPVVNDITFPAAILQPPFFDPEADAAENFGAIGAVIGHEIGHGFDDQGSRYDGLGNLNSWWTEQDREAFDKLTSTLVKQFDGLIPSVLEGKEGIDGVNGEFTLGENIGDLGGLGIAVVAYQMYLKDKGLDDGPEQPFDVEGADPALDEEEYTGMQRLFLAWARVWRTAIRPEMAEQYLAIDPHSPAEFRCNVIAANIDDFYEAFPTIDESSPMWIAPENRVTIW